MNTQAMELLRREMTPHSFVLENGLTVLVSEMPEYKGVHAVYATRFGSADKMFELDGEQTIMPDGVAHFLEHKMFETEDGTDAFSLYAATGASANAYTSFDKTCYIFTATQAVEKSLDILLNFVSHPYFTAETIAKEQGIIGQEIRMYDDNADFRMTFSLLKGLYHNCPVREDIAGSVESIAQITPQLLYRCCEAFYTPDNMVLSVAGNITSEAVLAACERANIPAHHHTLKRMHCPEPADVCCAHTEFSMEVAQPIWGIGYKEDGALGNTVHGELLCDFLTELLVGDTSALYRRLYDDGLINAGFGGEYITGDGYCALLFSGETKDPARVQRLFLQEVERIRREGVDREQFACTKNMMLGEAISELESIEDVATDQASVWLHGRTLYEELEALAQLSCEEVETALQTMLLEKNSCTVLISPTPKQGT